MVNVVIYIAHVFFVLPARITKSREMGWAVRPKATWLFLCSHNFALSLEQTPTMPAIILNLTQTQGLHAGASFSARSAKFNSIMRRKHIGQATPNVGRLARSQLILYCTLYASRHRPPHGHPGLGYGPVVRAIFSRSLLSLLQGCRYRTVRTCVRARVHTYSIAACPNATICK